MILALAATLAIVIQDHAALRAAPRSGATELARLWQGDVLEVRGERAGYLKVYDYRRERGGYLRATRRGRSSSPRPPRPNCSPCCASCARAPAPRRSASVTARRISRPHRRTRITAEPFDAIAQMAERLADQASGSTEHLADVAPHLEVVEQFGVHMRSFERNGRMRVCYDGELFRRVLALPGAQPEERARAVLGLTRPDCIDPDWAPCRAHPSTRSAPNCSSRSMTAN